MNTTRKTAYAATALCLAIVAVVIALRAAGGGRAAGPAAGERTAGAVGERAPVAPIIAAPGVVEPLSEEIELGAEMAGKLREVIAEEGERVTRGQLLAVLENDDYAAACASAESQIASAEAQAAAAAARLEQARAALRRTINGARAEERRGARAEVEQASAVARNAETEARRRRTLFADGDISREELERAERDANVAAARERELRERAAFVEAAAREEDVARDASAVRSSEAQVSEARARINEARARLSEARARLEKSYIRSPIAGVVLRKRRRAGESVSPEVPNSSIFTVADTSELRVRVDVDERDVGGVSVGQRAYVTAEAYGARRFTGRVVSVGQVLGRKNVRTEEPAEPVDKKILETLVALDDGQRLPPGLRVDAFIVVGEAGSAGRRADDAPRER